LVNNELNKDKVLEVLGTVMDPELGSDLVSLNMISSATVEDGIVSVLIELTVAGCPLKAKIEDDCKTAIRSINGVKDVKIKFTSKPVHDNREVKLPNIKHIIAISSGKGGVGKTTAAINIAKAFAKKGYSVGLLDADIYGPNIPLLLDNYSRPDVMGDEKLVPVEHDGIKFISVGLLLEPGQPVIWRGPMLHNVIKQFLSDVYWGDLDYLFVDLPPGTGDVQLSLCQLTKITGTIAVTTPQKLSVEDVKKGIAMFRQLRVDVLGIVENMSYYIHPSNNEKIFVFGKDGGKKLAEDWNIPLLAQIPIDPSISEKSENGLKYFEAIVDKIKIAIENLQSVNKLQK